MVDGIEAPQMVFANHNRSTRSGFLAIRFDRPWGKTPGDGHGQLKDQERRVAQGEKDIFRSQTLKWVTR